MYDTHVHSDFSHDGKSSLGDYSALIDKGMEMGIGFAEHVDYLPECGGYGLFDYDAYRSAIDAYKSRGYDFYAGAEIDYAKRAEGEIIDSLRHRHFDYTICSVHMVNGLSVSTDENIKCFLDEGTFKDMMEKYYRELNSSLKVETFDVIGHIGIYRRYLQDEFFKKCRLSSWIEEADDELAKACALSGKIIEVNTSGLFAPTKNLFPNRGFLARYFGYGGRLISMGSDAHVASSTSRGFEEAKHILKEIGFKYIFLPWDKNKGIGI